jgi:hypothetical protein
VPIEQRLPADQLLPWSARRPVHGDVPARYLVHQRYAVRRRPLSRGEPDAVVQHERGAALLRGALPERRRVPSPGPLHLGRALRTASLFDVPHVLELRRRQRKRTLSGEELSVGRRLRAGLLREGWLSGIAWHLRAHVRMRAGRSASVASARKKDGSGRLAKGERPHMVKGIWHWPRKQPIVPQLTYLLSQVHEPETH